MPTVTRQCTKDSYVSSSNPNSNYGSATTVYMRSGGGITTHGLVEFDASDIVRSSVTSVKIYWYQVYTTISAPNSTIMRLLGEFTENTVTMNNQPDITVDNAVSFGMSQSNGWIETDITNMFKAGSGNTFGISVRTAPQPTTPNYVYEFYSKERSGGAYRPYIVITYNDVPLPTNDWYVRPGGAGVANGYDWDNALATVDAGMRAVAANKTLHIGFGTYNSEPAGNTQSPVNAGVTVKFETIGSTGGTGTATVKQN